MRVVRRAAAGLIVLLLLGLCAGAIRADSFSDALVHADTARADGYTGRGVTVALLDTGVDTRLPFLAAAVVAEHCIVPPAGCPGGTAEADGPGSAQDDQGHGTEIAGILLGVAPDVRLIDVKVADQNGRSSSAQIQAGLDWLRIYHPEARIVNVSLAGDIPLSGNCSTLTAALASYSASVAALRAQGTLLFAASGNDGRPNGLPAPACFPVSVAVGAVYSRTAGAVTAPNICRDAHPVADEVACWSNASSELDLLAPGAPIATVGLGGRPETFAGTSAASAVASGAAALLLQAKPSLTADDLESLLERTGVPITDPRRRKSIPRIDLDQALARLLGEPTSHPRGPRVDISS
jgi:subtilisin family serine protease